MRYKFLATIVLSFLLFNFHYIDAEAKGIPILLYHQVTYDAIDPSISITPDAFETQIAALKDRGFETITSDVMIDYMNGQTVSLPDKPIVLTFDDGYVDNYENAYPILKSYGYTAIIFMVAKNVDRQGRLSSSMLKEMAANGFEIGSHTVNHKFLNQATELEICREIEDSKTSIEKSVGQKVKLFSYPGGFYNWKAYEEVTKFYQCGVTTIPGVNSADKGNVYLMKRIPIFSFTNFDDVLSCID